MPSPWRCSLPDHPSCWCQLSRSKWVRLAALSTTFLVCRQLHHRLPSVAPSDPHNCCRVIQIAFHGSLHNYVVQIQSAGQGSAGLSACPFLCRCSVTLTACFCGHTHNVEPPVVLPGPCGKLGYPYRIDNCTEGNYRFHQVRYSGLVRDPPCQPCDNK